DFQSAPGVVRQHDSQNIFPRKHYPSPVAKLLLCRLNRAQAPLVVLILRIVFAEKSIAYFLERNLLPDSHFVLPAHAVRALTDPSEWLRLSPAKPRRTRSRKWIQAKISHATQAKNLAPAVRQHQ